MLDSSADEDRRAAHPFTGIETTVGRVTSTKHLPAEIPFINGLLKKRGLQDLVGYCYINHGNDLTVQMLDQIKEVTLRLRQPRRHFDRRRGHGDPAGQGRA